MQWVYSKDSKVTWLIATAAFCDSGSAKGGPHLHELLGVEAALLLEWHKVDAFRRQSFICEGGLHGQRVTAQLLCDQQR